MSIRSSQLLVLGCIPMLLAGCLGAGAKSPECRQGEGLSAAGISGSSLSAGEFALVFGGPLSEASAVSEIAGFLALQNIRAGFFIYGESVRENKGTLASLKRSGQLVGNSFYSSHEIQKLRDPVLAAIRTDQLLTPYVTGSIFLLRFPGGGDDRSMAKLLNRQGLAKYAGPIISDIGGSDGKSAGGFSADQCANAEAGACTQSLLAAARKAGKGIVELPLGRAVFATVVRDFVSAMTAEGFVLRDLDEVPDIQFRVQQSGGMAGAATGAGSCNDY